MQAKDAGMIRPRLRSRGKTSDGLPNKIDVHIGSRIRLKRQLLGLTQEEVGKQLGLTFQQVQKYEKGQNRVSGSRLYDFACLLEVGVDFFFQDMPEDIRRQSPRYISAGQSESNSEIEEMITRTSNLLNTNRAIKIMQAFAKLPSPQVAEKFYDLLMLLSSSPYKMSKLQAAALDEESEKK